jgi:hypothetical protein
MYRDTAYNCVTEDVSEMLSGAVVFKYCILWEITGMDKIGAPTGNKLSIKTKFSARLAPMFVRDISKFGVSVAPG